MNPHFVAGIEWVPTLLLSGVLALALLGFGAALGTILGRRNARRPDAPRARVNTRGSATADVQTASPTPAVDRTVLETVTGQRAALIGGCVQVRSLLDDQVLAGLLDDALTCGGVDTFDPTGTPMDPTRHHVTGTVAAQQHADDGIIARTLAAGYLDHGRVLRPADVVVYKWAQQ